MSNLFWLTEAQVARMSPCFPKSRGKPRVDDRRVLSGIIFINRNGSRWCDAPSAYGPPKTLYNRWRRWSRMGVFDRILQYLIAETLAAEEEAARKKAKEKKMALKNAGKNKTSNKKISRKEVARRKAVKKKAARKKQEETSITIDSTYLKAHRTSASMLVTEGVDRQIGRCRGGLATKCHAVVDHKGRPHRLHMTAGNIADATGARVLVKDLPKAKWFPGDWGYDANRLRNALKELWIKPCIPGRKSRKTPIRYNKWLYWKRHRIENSLGRIKDWRRIAMRYDRCPTIFRSAVTLATIILFWL